MNNNDQQFRDLMKLHKPEKAPANFSLNVMEQIKKEDSVVSTTYQPAFGKWFFRGLLFFLGLLFIYGIFGNFTDPDVNIPGAVSGKLPNLNWNGLTALEYHINYLLAGIPSVVWLTLIAATALLLLDILVLKRTKNSVLS